jgi:hypothetical protein
MSPLLYQLSYRPSWLDYAVRLGARSSPKPMFARRTEGPLFALCPMSKATFPNPAFPSRKRPLAVCPILPRAFGSPTC